MNKEKGLIKFGFTLIELLITIGIMVLLVTLYIPYHRKFARKNELRMAVQEMKEKILQAQSLALAPQHTYPGLDESATSYYRFVFDPDDPKGVHYEIRTGYFDFSLDSNGIRPWSGELEVIRGGETTVESGYLPKNISSTGPFWAIKTFDGQREGTIIFDMIKGNCFYAWRKPGANIEQKYTFENQLDEEASIIINLSSCKVETEGPE